MFDLSISSEIITEPSGYGRLTFIILQLKAFFRTHSKLSVSASSLWLVPVCVDINVTFEHMVYEIDFTNDFVASCSERPRMLDQTIANIISNVTTIIYVINYGATVYSKGLFWNLIIEAQNEF